MASEHLSGPAGSAGSVGHAGPAHGAAALPEHVVPVWQYFVVYLALLALTGLTVLAAFQDLGRMNNVVALGIALTKATLVVLIFMHLRWSSRLVALFLGAGLFGLGYMILASLSDYFTRGMLGVPGK